MNTALSQSALRIHKCYIINSKLCENTLPCGRRVSTQFLVFPISTRVDITVYQHGKCFIFLKYQHKWKLEKQEIVWKHDARWAECFHTISSFQFSQVLL